MSDPNNFGASHAFMTGDGADDPNVLENATPQVEVSKEEPKLSPGQLETQQRLEAHMRASRQAAADAHNRSLYDPENPKKILSEEEEVAEQIRRAKEEAEGEVQ